VVWLRVTSLLLLELDLVLKFELSFVLMRVHDSVNKVFRLCGA
jgi:hypothetical protein